MLTRVVVIAGICRGRKSDVKQTGNLLVSTILTLRHISRCVVYHEQGTLAAKTWKVTENLLRRCLQVFQEYILYLTDKSNLSKISSTITYGLRILRASTINWFALLITTQSYVELFKITCQLKNSPNSQSLKFEMEMIVEISYYYLIINIHFLIEAPDLDICLYIFVNCTIISQLHFNLFINLKIFQGILER